MRSTCVAVAVGGLLLFAEASSAQSPRAAQPALERLAQLTGLLRAAANGAGPGNLDEVIAERRALMLSAMESAPVAALQQAIPANLRASLPASVRSQIETEDVVEGELELLYEDYDNGAVLRRYVRDGNRRVSVHFASEPDEMRTGDRVRVRGVRLNEVLAADGEGAVVIQVASALPYTFGDQRTLMILVNFSDRITQPYTTATAHNMIFTTVNDFDRENSQNQISFSGDVIGWFTIAASSTTCDYNAIRTQAQAAAQGAGVALSTYRRFIYAFPTNACTWWGLGQVGGSPTHAWINGSLQLRVAAHELGHNLGVYHSNAFECGSATLGTACSTIEYGDPADIMGNSGLVAHFNSFQKERMGWLNYGSSQPILTVQGDGVYTIEPYAGAGTGAKALKILKSVDASGRRTFFYVEQRFASGYDSALSGRPGITNGVMIHTGSEATGNSSFALDMTPETSAWTDAALPVGRTFTDPVSGVTITPLSVGAGGATINVTLGNLACVASAPTVAISPAPGPLVAAGTLVNYTVTVTNRNNAGCAASSFNVSAQAPAAGWTAALSSAALSLASGASGAVTLTVNSPATAPAPYSVPVSATDSSSGLSGSASATYRVAGAPSITLSTDRTVYARNQTVSLTARVTASGAPLAGVLVNFVITRSNGSRVSSSVMTNTSGQAILPLRLRKYDPAGVYQATSSTLAGGVTVSATTSFTVQ